MMEWLSWERRLALVKKTGERGENEQQEGEHECKDHNVGIDGERKSVCSD